MEHERLECSLECEELEPKMSFTKKKHTEKMSSHMNCDAERKCQIIILKHRPL